MVATRQTAARNAVHTTTNDPDTCQYQVRTWLEAPSAGDRDHDGDADAVDGWVSEPPTARHTDRRPPLGTPVSWSGGSAGHGHRALSLGPDANGVYLIRSTDRPARGKTSTVPLADIEQAWGLHYLGWSDTIDGYPIPTDSAPVAGSRTLVPRAIRLTEKAAIRAEAQGRTARARTLRAALALLRTAQTQRRK